MNRFEATALRVKGMPSHCYHPNVSLGIRRSGYVAGLDGKKLSSER